MNEDVHKAYDEVIEDLMKENHSLRVKKRWWKALAITTLTTITMSLVILSVIL